jgi:hypothetical protein
MPDRLAEIRDAQEFERGARFCAEVLRIAPDAPWRRQYESLMREFAEWKRERGIRWLEIPRGGRPGGSCPLGRSNRRT